MKQLNKAGFTIIETMLFLGISGLLIMGILIGTGTSINAQRYRDSLTTLQSLIQDQYSAVANVANDNVDSNDANVTNNYICKDNQYGYSVTQKLGSNNSGDQEHPGQTECVILGKMIVPVKDTDSKQLKVYDISGYLSDSSDAQDDITALKSYKLGLLGSKVYDLDWGVSLTQKGSGGSVPLNFTILILRSPSSGVIRTFVTDTTTSMNGGDMSGVKNLISVDSSNEPLYICVNPQGLSSGPIMGVLLRANATSAGGVELLGDNSGC